MSKERRQGEDRRQVDSPVESERREETRRRRAGERRGVGRIKKRIPCEVQLDGSWQRAFVLDVSFGGLFVQTGKAVTPGIEVGVRLTVPGDPFPIEVRGTVARNRRVPAQLAGVETPGLGLKIFAAPNAYYDMVAELSEKGGRALSAKPEPAAPKRPAKPEFEFRVRAKQTSGSRSRMLVVSAASPEEAETRALRELGAKWKVLGVERV
jgi:hypothetical protein